MPQCHNSLKAVKETMSETTVKKLKAADRQAVARKVITLLKKKYGGSVPKHSLPVLETVLYAICLENCTSKAADAAFQRLLDSFHDLNEIRVSSISEIEQVLSDLPDPEWRALRIREVLQFTFEKHYAFDLDVLKRKTMDIAEKQLAKIRYITPFVRGYVLQQCLGSHVVPVDSHSQAALAWMGFIAPTATDGAAAEEMKSAVKKQDAPLFCHLLRELTCDRKYSGTFIAANAAEEGVIDATTAPERLKSHLARPPRPKKKASPKKSRKAVKKTRKKPTKTARPKKAARKKAGAKVVTKKVAKKTAKKKKTTKRRTSSR